MTVSSASFGFGQVSPRLEAGGGAQFARAQQGTQRAVASGSDRCSQGPECMQVGRRAAAPCGLGSAVLTRRQRGQVGAARGVGVVVFLVMIARDWYGTLAPWLPVTSPCVC